MGNAIANVTRQSYDLGGGVRGGVEPAPPVSHFDIQARVFR